MRRPAIPAAISSSDFAKRAELDASGWFATAPAETIVALARDSWRGDRFARDLAAHCLAANDALADVLQYVMYLRHGGLRSGFRCSVDAAAALEWLARSRPDVAAALRKANL